MKKTYLYLFLVGSIAGILLAFVLLNVRREQQAETLLFEIKTPAMSRRINTDVMLYQAGTQSGDLIQGTRIWESSSDASGKQFQLVLIWEGNGNLATLFLPVKDDGIPPEKKALATLKPAE